MSLCGAATLMHAARRCTHTAYSLYPQYQLTGWMLACVVRVRFRLRYAQEMPRGVCQIVRVHDAMRLELCAAVSVSASVVESDTSLPELRRFAGSRLRQRVESGDRIVDAAILE